MLNITRKIGIAVGDVYTNYCGTRHLTTITKTNVVYGMCLTYLSNFELSQVKKEYLNIFKNRLSYTRLLIYFLFRKKLCFVLRDNSGKALAYLFIYFNKDELRKGYIHLGAYFRSQDCLVPAVGAIIERSVLDYLSQNLFFKGITAKVTISNTKSCNIFKHDGFGVVHEFIEEGTGEKRVYLLKRFERTHD